MKKIVYSLMMVMALFMMSSCNSEDKLDPNTLLYQDYYVEITNGETSVFANFRESNSAGLRVKLNNGSSIAVNGTAMTYVNGAQVEGTYDYYTSLKNADEATFVFKRNSSTTLTNTLNFSMVPEFTLPGDMKKVANSETYTVTKTTAGLSSATMKVLMVNASNVSYNAIVGADNASFTFSGVPKGTYKLFVAYYTSTSVAQSNGSAGGKMTLYRITTVEGVTVE